MTSAIADRPLPRVERRYRPLEQVLVRRRRLRTGLEQAAFVVAGVGLGLAAPRLTAGPTVDAAATSSLLVGVAASIVPFVGLVYSLLFLVVQFGSTNLTPRLNLFRENPLVWRAFGYFIGFLVWAGAAAMASKSHDRVSVVVPAAALIGVLVALGLFRALVTMAFASIQLATTLRDVRDHGRAVIDAIYREPYEDQSRLDESEAVTGPRTEVRWNHRGGILRQIDLPALVRAAADADGLIELTVAPGDTVRENGVIAIVRGGHGEIDDAAFSASFEVGLERTFHQDPRFAFRLLVDIAVRALSPAINDQATAVQVLDTIDGLLSALSERHLDIGRIHVPNRHLQVLIPVPTWEDYVDLALSDIAASGGRMPPVSQRLLRLINDIAASAPVPRRPPLDLWRSRLMGLRAAQP